jgi:chemotaxis methyl-accepting protein methylase
MQPIDDFRQFLERYYSQDVCNAFSPSEKDRSLSLDALAKKFFSQLPTRTRMFREYVTDTFNKYVLPKIREKTMPRVLSLPCSNGEEVYTLAMLGLDNDIYLRVEGMDVNHNLIDIAESGKLSLPWDKVKKLSEPVKKGYLRRQNNFPNVIINPHVKDRCGFQVCDILTQQVSCDTEAYDAVYCLNLFCYLSEFGREEAVQNLLVNMEEGTLLIVDEPYWVPPPNTRAGQARYNGKDEQLYGWKLDLNRFLETLPVEKEDNDRNCRGFSLRSRGFGLRRISMGNSSNVYEKI